MARNRDAADRDVAYCDAADRDAADRDAAYRDAAGRDSGAAAGSGFRIVARLLGVAAVFVLVLTFAPFGRPDSTAIVAGRGADVRAPQASVGAGSTVTVSTSSTIVRLVETLPGPEAPPVPFEIDLALIAATVEPEDLGFDIEPGTWDEPEIEPEDRWVDAGNGVALPDLLLRIRFCESTNNYRAAHVASSARGAYQFLSTSWAWYGHAERYGVAEAHLATPAQQDEAALLTYRQVGARPWAESRPCWDDPAIDPRYLTARPPPPLPTTTTSSTPPSSEPTAATTASTDATTSSTQTTTPEPSSTTTVMSVANEPTTTAG
jgi:hypothetical protein